MPGALVAIGTIWTIFSFFQMIRSNRGEKENAILYKTNWYISKMLNRITLWGCLFLIGIGIVMIGCILL